MMTTIGGMSGRRFSVALYAPEDVAKYIDINLISLCEFALALGEGDWLVRGSMDNPRFSWPIVACVSYR